MPLPALSLLTFFVLGVVLTSACSTAEPQSDSVLPVAHRGLLKHAPENTRSNFRAALELRLGFEVDVRRSKDGTLVCVHDDTVDRTTNGHGAVNSLTLTELRKLDAGSWFRPAFRGERIPTFEEVLELIARHGHPPVLIAIDLKAEQIEADCVKAAKAHQVLDRLLFIGNAINSPQVRRQLRASDPHVHVACLANHANELAAAIEDRDSNWCYLRFIPTGSEVDRVHAAGKKVFIAGATVAGIERDNWRLATSAGTDAILTDYPLELIEAAGQVK